MEKNNKGSVLWQQPLTVVPDGGSTALRLPKALCAELGIRPGDRVIVTAYADKSLQIRKEG